MSDIVHWLRKLAALVEADHAPQHVVMHMRAGADEIERLRAENERLRIENIQMQAALGYAIMAEDERHILPSNPFKCGTCDANSRLRADNERLRAALTNVMVGGNSLAQIIGADHPPHGTPYGEALAHYGSGVKYEAWCCWNTIMQARAALDGQPAPGKEEA